MGYSLAWLAIRGKSRDEIHRELKITPTGTHADLLDAPCMGAQLGDWYLVFKDHDVFDDLEQVARLAQGCEVVSCFVEEHVMCSEVTGWRDGKKIWSIIHSSEKKSDYLKAQGDLPSGYEAIRDRLESQQTPDSCDYIFDIPVETARLVTGFRHDDPMDPAPLAYEVLHIVVRPTASRGFIWLLRKLTGR